jgi:hypothetical protein
MSTSSADVLWRKNTLFGSKLLRYVTLRFRVNTTFLRKALMTLCIKERCHVVYALRAAKCHYVT